MIHVSPVLHVGLLRQGREGEGGTEERAEAAQGKEGSGRLGSGWLFYREKLNIGRSKINYSYVIHLTFESSI
jgi:hypothetical protein